MSEIDVTKCRFYLDDGSCSSHDTDCTKCIHCYCDWKVHQEQLHSCKQVVKEIKEIAENFCNACKEFEPNKCNEINLRYCNYNKIIQKCEEVNEINNR